IGDTHAVGDVTVSASQTVDVDSQSFGLAGGIIAAAVNFSFVTVDPTVTAAIGSNAAITATGDVKVTAATDIDASSQALGVAVGGGSLAASFARSEVSPIVHAYVGESAGVNTTGGGITVRATHNEGKASRGARANATSGSGGVLFGASGAVAIADEAADVEAYTDDSSTVSASGTVETSADTTNTAHAKAAGLGGGGFLGVGISA